MIRYAHGAASSGAVAVAARPPVPPFSRAGELHTDAVTRPASPPGIDGKEPSTV